MAQTPMTLDGAIAQAIAHNPLLRVEHAAADRAAAEVAEARASWFPRVSFSEGARRGDASVFVFSSLLAAQRFTATNFAIDMLNHPAAVTFYQRTLGVDQVLFDGGRTRAASRLATGRREMADASVVRAAADLVVSVSQTYGRILSADAERHAAEAAIDAAREDMARAEHRRDVGTATDADVLALSAYLADVQQRGLRASGDAAIARAQLNRLIGVPITADLVVVEPVPDAPASRDLSALIAEAEAARPELASASAAGRVAEAGLGAARAAWWPQVAGQAAYEQDGLAFADRASSWTAGVELRWSLSAGGAEIARMREAAADVAQARASRDDVKEAIDEDVVSAVAREQSAHARLEAGRAAVTEARESQRIIRDRYDAGMAPMNDVLRAASAVLEAERLRVTALVDALVADAMLNRAIGRTSLPSR